MVEAMPPTGITLGEAKQYLSDNFIEYTITETGEEAFGLYVYDVKAMEEVLEINSIRRRNFRLYTDGLEDTANAWWEATQGPTSAPEPEPPFNIRLEEYLKTKVEDSTIKFGFIVQSSELTQKAICNVIMPDNSDKSLLVSEDVVGVFSHELLV